MQPPENEPEAVMAEVNGGFLIADGVEVEPGKLVVPRPNPKFDKTAPISDDNLPYKMSEVDGVALTFSIHGGGGSVSVMFPRKFAADVRKGIRELEGVNIVEATADQMPKGNQNGASPQ